MSVKRKKKKIENLIGTIESKKTLNRIELNRGFGESCQLYILLVFNVSTF